MKVVGYFFRFPRTKRQPPRLLKTYAPAVTRRKRIVHNSLPVGSSVFRFSAGVFRNSQPLSY